MPAIVLRPVHLAVAVLLAALLLAGVQLAAPADAKPPRKGPAGAAFYDPPKHLPKRHGKLIWQRRARGITPIAGARTNRLVLYASRTPQGRRTAVSGSVAVPKGKAPRGGWPVISYAHGTTGSADVCAPTRVKRNSPAAPYVTYVDPEMEEWVAAGYAVVRTDYQGLGTPGKHPYLVGKAEGRGVLDIVRAARQLRLNVGKRVLIAGHSQGGQAALFAAGMADGRWGKGLRVRGTVAYAPASHLVEQFEFLPAIKVPSPLSALATMILQGASTTSKQIRPRGLLSRPAWQLYPELDELCLAETGLPDSLGGIAPADLLRKSADTTALTKALERINPDVRAGAPILLAQGTADTTVLPTFTDQLNGELDERGNRVRYLTYPGVTHPEIVAAAENDAMAFFHQRLPGR